MVKRLLICGGRHFDNAACIEFELSSVHARTPIGVMVHGGSPAIGFPAEAWARRNNVHVIRYPANFSLGKSADFARDLFMLDDCRPDMILVFPGGRRTAEFSKAAEERRVPLVYAEGSKADLSMSAVR